MNPSLLAILENAQTVRGKQGRKQATLPGQFFRSCLEHDVNPRRLVQLAADLRAAAQRAERSAAQMLTVARRKARAIGLSPEAIVMSAARGIDHDSLRGWDEVAEFVALEYPEFFPPGADLEARLLEVMLIGAPAPLSVPDSLDRAFTYLVGRETAGTLSAEPLPE